MVDFENELVQLLRAFTGQVAAVVRRHALESAGAALERTAEIPTVKGRSRPADAGRSPRPRPTRPGSKSNQVFDAEAVKPQVVSYLLANPGLRMDELGKQLNLPTTKLKPLVKKLVGERMLRAKGNTRARQYFAAKSATSAGRRGAKAGRTRRKKT
jgi:hypothetical protein